MLSIDMTAFMDSMMTWAASWFNALIPIFGIVVGIAVGLGLIYLVVTEVRKALPSR